MLFLQPFVKPGQRVVCVEDGLPTWVAEVIVSRPTVKEAIQYVKDIESDMQAHMHITPTPHHHHHGHHGLA